MCQADNLVIWTYLQLSDLQRKIVLYAEHLTYMLKKKYPPDAKVTFAYTVRIVDLSLRNDRTLTLPNLVVFLLL